MRIWLRAAAAALPLLAALTALAAPEPASPAQDARRKQEILFAELKELHVDDAPFVIGARATSGLPVAFEVISGPATLEDAKLTLVGTSGIVIIRATQAGNAEFQPALPAERVLVVKPAPSAPSIVSQPAGGHSEIGDSIALSVEASGEPAPALQWRRDGAPLSGATDKRLTIAPAALADAGAYDVVASNPLGSATSERVRVTVTKRRQTLMFQGPFSAAVGVPVTLSANATSGLPVRFEVLSGAAVMNGPAITAQQPGTVLVRMSQPGDATFEAAEPVDQSLPVAARP